MEDLSFSVPAFEDNELFSFFFGEGEPTLTPTSSSAAKDESAAVSFKDPNAADYHLEQPLIEDFSLANDEQIPSLFPLLDQLKIEPIEEEVMDSSAVSAPSNTMDIEPVQNIKKPKGKPRGRRKKVPKEEEAEADETEKKVSKSKRAPTERKNSKRPTKKQKVELKTSFIASLKGLTSAELEEIAATRSLTPKEQSDLKHYTRMIKNRESAQLSRERRKIYQDTLEKALAEEGARNESLKKQIFELEIENKVLQREFLEFKALIENSNLGKAFSTFTDNNAFKHMAKTAAAGDNTAQATFAMYMLIVLHAFSQQFAAPETTNFIADASVAGPVEARA